MNDNTLKSDSLLKSGEYRIERTLGQGGFGITYEAEQTSLGRKVAVKEFFMKEYCERDGGTSHVTMGTSGSKELVTKFRDKFIREARMIAALDHEHIVKIIDVFEENGTAYYVMEYLGGGSLDRKIKDKGAMPESVALDFIRQISDALSYLHSQNILHFDIKPANVLLGKNGSAKLIDFGISKHYDEVGHQTSSTPVGISKGYAPLEQYQQGSDIKSFTPATDIYSLGATLFALLTGSNPPEASVIYEDGLPVIEGVRPSVMHAIEKAMQPRRKDRPQSVAEFLTLLDGTAREDDDEQTVVPASTAKEPNPEKAGTPAQKSVKPQKSEEQKSKGFPKWLYGLIAGVVVAVLAVVLLNRHDKADTPDNLQADSTAVVAEAVPEKPVTSKPTASVSKPEIPSKSEAPSKPEAPAVVELKSISLSKTSLELEEGSSATLTVKYSPNNATDKTTTWKSSDASVAKVSSGGKVTALKAGSAAIIATCGGKDAYCNVTVKAKEVQTQSPVTSTGAALSQQLATSTTSSSSSQSDPLLSTTGTHNGHEYVDLGLSVKWATCNVGASSPEGYGSYFAWSETRPKSEYTWENLKYSNGNLKFSKYVTESNYGPVDNTTRLEMSDDAARQNWGSSWRMPTINEFQELIDRCTWIWTKVNGENGYKVVSKMNGNSIFLPASGLRNGTSQKYAGDGGYYWSSSLDWSNTYNAGYLYFHSKDYKTSNYYRNYGRSVRPVFR